MGKFQNLIKKYNENPKLTLEEALEITKCTKAKLAKLLRDNSCSFPFLDTGFPIYEETPKTYFTILFETPEKIECISSTSALMLFNCYTAKHKEWKVLLFCESTEEIQGIDRETCLKNKSIKNIYNEAFFNDPISSAHYGNLDRV